MRGWASAHAASNSASPSDRSGLTAVRKRHRRMRSANRGLAVIPLRMILGISR